MSGSARSSEAYISELEKIAEKASASSKNYCYFYEDQDTNKLKNTIMTYMLCDDYTIYHKHDFFEFNFVVKGNLYEHISGRSFTLREGDLLIMSPSVFHTCCPDTDAICFNLLFRVEHLEKIAASFEKYDPGNYLSSLVKNKIYTIFSLGEDKEKISEIILNLYEMSTVINHHMDLFENLNFETACTSLLVRLSTFPRHEYSFISQNTKRETAYTPEDMVRYIYDNFDRISLDDTAARFGYSRCQFHRIIKQNTGKSFSDIILSIRMQRARHYLLNTVMPINNIAHLLGLDSTEHFSRMFKKHRGMSPKEYRNTFSRKSIYK